MKQKNFKNKYIILLILSLALLAALAFVFFGEKRKEIDGGITKTAGPFKIGIKTEPPAPATGKNFLHVTINGLDGEPVRDADVKLEAVMQAMGSMPKMVTRSDLIKSDGARYTLQYELSMRGEWQAELHIDVAERHEHLSFEIITGKAGVSFPTASGVQEYYTCPMHPSVKAKAPGPCPICGMDLVLAKKDASEVPSIALDATKRQLIGVRTEAIKRQNLVREILTVGDVKYDEATLTDISLKISGWIGEIFADFTGKSVKKGEPLFTVYSPELVSAQQEYLEAASRNSTPSPILEAAKQRLLYWDWTEQQISDLTRRGKPLAYSPIVSPSTGTVIEKHIVSGSALQPGSLLYRIADLSRVWVEAELYDQELMLVELGSKVSVSLPYLPGKTYTGKVEFLYPYVTENTRTGRARVILENPEGTIRPGTYANVKLKVSLGKHLAVPAEAVIFAGQTRIVFVDTGAGTLEPRRVKLGYRAGDVYQVIDGLESGENVVTSGNFLIASEAKIKLGIEKW